MQCCVVYFETEAKSRSKSQMLRRLQQIQSMPTSTEELEEEPLLTMGNQKNDDPLSVQHSRSACYFLAVSFMLFVVFSLFAFLQVGLATSGVVTATGKNAMSDPAMSRNASVSMLPIGLCQ